MPTEKSRLLKAQNSCLIIPCLPLQPHLRYSVLAICALAFWFSQLSAHMLLSQPKLTCLHLPFPHTNPDWIRSLYLMPSYSHYISFLLFITIISLLPFSHVRLLISKRFKKIKIMYICFLGLPL